MAHDKNMISLFEELKASITTFYSTHSVLHTNGTIDIQEVLNKMSKLDLFLAGDFKGLWEMERAERLKPDDLSTIEGSVDELSECAGLTHIMTANEPNLTAEQTVILNPEEYLRADPLRHIGTAQWFQTTEEPKHETHPYLDTVAHLLAMDLSSIHASIRK